MFFVYSAHVVVRTHIQEPIRTYGHGQYIHTPMHWPLGFEIPVRTLTHTHNTHIERHMHTHTYQLRVPAPESMQRTIRRAVLAQFTLPLSNDFQYGELQYHVMCAHPCQHVGS